MKIGKDKWKHFGVCAGITFIIGIFVFCCMLIEFSVMENVVLLKCVSVMSAISGAMAALGAAFGKEFGDFYNAEGEGWSFTDLLADVIGVFVGVIVLSICMLIIASVY